MEGCFVRNHYHIRVYDTKSGREAFDKIVTKEGSNGQTLLVSNLKPYTNFTFTIQAKTIEPGEMVYFTAKTLEGGTSVFVQQLILQRFNFLLYLIGRLVCL